MTKASWRLILSPPVAHLRKRAPAIPGAGRAGPASGNTGSTDTNADRGDLDAGSREQPETLERSELSVRALPKVVLRSRQESNCSMKNFVLRLTRTALKRMVPDTDFASAALVEKSFRADYAVISAEFDRQFYLLRYPDVATAKADPVLHYLKHGWKERRDPRADFSTGNYLDLHPDIADAGVNPFVHFIVAGRSEGRAFQHPLANKAEVLARLKPIRDRLPSWTGPDALLPLLGTKDIRDAVSVGLKAFPAGLIVAITHDDYIQNSGGIQVAIRTEEAAALQEGFAYLAVWPWQALPCLSVESDPIVSFRLNGQPLGIARISVLIAALAEGPVDPTKAQLIIHSLLSHDPGTIAALAKAVGRATGWYWLHDYFGICPSYTLQRNDQSYCGAPPSHSAACGICIYGPDRKSHHDRLRVLFDTLALTIISPSEAALAIWSRAANFATSATLVHPHVQLVFSPEPHGPGADQSAWNQPANLRFAFLGATVAHKGWDEYLGLAQAFNGTKGREFHYFGHYKNVPDHVRSTNVQVTGDKPDAMLNAVRAAGIDVFINWPAWPETFSFTTFEAMGAGAIVLTNQISGNVASVVRLTGKGRVFETFDQLVAFVKSPGLTRLVTETRAARRTQSTTLARSRMTLDLIAPRGPGE